MKNINNAIEKLLSESISNSIKYNLTEILKRNNIHYIMIDIDCEVPNSISENLEQKILTELNIQSRVCFIQNHSTAKHKKNQNSKKAIDGVKKVIMVCSGKGGVGKSTISSIIAYCLNMQGFRVGLFDADIYGPSITKIFDVNQEVLIDDGKFIPHEKYGIKLMSMGFIVQSNDALIWRGPMVSKTLHNMLMHTKWYTKNCIGMKTELDYLIIDTPPGTGDVHLSLIENYFIDGAILVSTPQELAISNTHRSFTMLKKLNIKLFGMIENMAYIENENGTKNYIFGQNNVNQYALSHNMQLLAQIPIIQNINLTKDLHYIKILSKVLEKIF